MRVFRQLPLYSLIGLVGVSLDVAAFALLYKVLGMNPYLANTLSTGLGITNNFVLNSTFTFAGRGRTVVRFLRFATVGAVGVLLTAGCFRTGFSLGIDDANVLKVASLLPVTLVQYLLNRQWSFR